MLRIPDRHMYSVRGIGVADRLRTSTSVAFCLIRSFCFTPNRCSSSTIKSPNRPHSTLSANNACVPTTTSTFPSGSAISSRRAAVSSRVRFTSDDSNSTRTSDPIRFCSTRRCCAASTVVGARKAT